MIIIQFCERSSESIAKICCGSIAHIPWNIHSDFRIITNSDNYFI